MTFRFGVVENFRNYQPNPFILQYSIYSDILIRYPERNPLKLKLGNIIKGLGNYCQMIDIFS